MSRHPEADLSRLRRTTIAARASQVDAERLGRPAGDPRAFAELWDGMPRLLAAEELRRLVRAILAARAAGRPVVWMFGAHVIKVGLGPLLIRLLRERWVTLLAVHGAFAIHDAELALWGATSEDVAAELPAGRFGMARETAELLAEAAGEACRREEGFGEALGRLILVRREAWQAESVLGTAAELGVPATIHVALGTDIVHQHPEFSGAETGEASARDFRILAAHLAELEGAVVVNVGSAVILPEVFLKAASVAINLGAKNTRLHTATFDFAKHYRPSQNIVQRPPGAGGRGFYFLGHHEILLPLLHQGLLLEELRAADETARSGKQGTSEPAGE
jgi:hypothetical protein